MYSEQKIVGEAPNILRLGCGDECTSLPRTQICSQEIYIVLAAQSFFCKDS